MSFLSSHNQRKGWGVEFTFYGAGSVLISTKPLKILIDPPEPSYKLKLPNLKAEVTLLSAQTNGGFEHEGDFKIDSPGEYEIKSVAIRGIGAQLHIEEPKSPARGVMYVIEYGGIKTLVTGNIAPNLSNQQVEDIGGDVNVLVVPVGGHGLTLDANAASNLVSQFEPNFVIPVHYDDGATHYPSPQAKVDNFLKEVGSEDAQAQPKLKVSAKNLEEGTKVALLKRP